MPGLAYKGQQNNVLADKNLLTIRIEGKTTIVWLPALTILYSYDTPVAFYHIATEQHYACRNIWGNTTGKHINTFLSGVDDKYITRLEPDEFNAELLSAYTESIKITNECLEDGNG